MRDFLAGAAAEIGLLDSSVTVTARRYATSTHLRTEKGTAN